MSVLNTVLGGPLGDVILRPWYDRAALWLVQNAYLPTSSAWAAAKASGDDSESFHSLLGQDRRPLFQEQRILDRIARLSTRYDAARDAWMTSFFGDAPHRDLERIQKSHIDAANALMNGRALFSAEHARQPFPAVRFAVDQPDTVAKRHAARLQKLSSAYDLPPDLSAIKTSKSLDYANRRLTWLTYPAGAAGVSSDGWARVDEDPGQAPCGTLIFCHGISMEREFWNTHYDPTDKMMSRSRSHWHGLRVIRPDGPWHGRRMIENRYGGEPILSRGPGGMLDYFDAHVREVALLVRWARETYGQPVAVGGVSLGALISQAVLSHCRNWPEDSRPEAALLLTGADSLSEIGFRGALGERLNLPEHYAEAGWTEAIADTYAPLLNAADEPGLCPDKIVMVIGRTDRVTPYQAGRRLAETWNVPESGVFEWTGGHFAAAMSVLRDHSPLDRLKAILSLAD